MPALTKLVAASAAEFSSHLATALASGAPTFALFTGAALPTGESWCPDCTTAKPVVHAAFEAAARAGDVALIEVPLVREEYRGNAEHWARKLAGVRLQRIPTLMKWGAAAKVAELVEGECAEEAKVRELVLGEQ